MDAGNQSDYLRILDQGLDTFAGEILLFHMKDCRLVNGAAPQQVPLGTGDLNMREILKRIRAYDENAVLMLEGTTGADIPHAVQTIDTIWKR
jgi:sugar phosphate isomerase/epimerase